ncbi:molybdopterin cofactor-binding domain-containing protein [Sphingomonas sp. LB2R24]|uniref:xanthine dehydrogenase family protein molybdopterin-binding subunit n=1 Tax=Sphingomonas sorbitolis TaxID=3096165 RepID=UPI002FCB281B
MSVVSPDRSRSRRDVLAGGGVFVAFSLAVPSLAQLVADGRGGRTEISGGEGGQMQTGGGEGGKPQILRPDLPGSLKSNPLLDSWIRLAPDGHVTVFSGKVELGQGIRTALLQVAAEELDLPPAVIDFVTGDTARTPHEGLTAGSHSMQDSGTAIANAAANVLMLLRGEAGKFWQLDPTSLATSGRGHVVAPDGRRLAYGQIAARLSLNVEARPDAPRRTPSAYRTLGRSMPRVDIPAKLVGGEAYVQDMRMPGMLHARVIRGPSFDTTLVAPRLDAARRMPGVVGIVRKGDFIAIVAKREWQAIQAMRVAQSSEYERKGRDLPVGKDARVLQSLASREIVILDTKNGNHPAVKSISASYSRPWLSHGSIGPSCAVALARNGSLSIWTHSQGVFDLQRVVAELVNLPLDKVRCIHVESAGCYGHNGADDVGADAAVIAQEFPGHPIRLQWMREQEFGWEPAGCAMVTTVEAGIGSDRRISHWNYEVWSNSHNNRPVQSGGVLVGQELDPPRPAQEPKPIPMPEGDGSRNSNPLYNFPNMNVLYHFVPEMPLRVSAIRSLGAHLNIFSLESMMDELAHATGVDPLAFRLAYMEDERARAVMIEATDRFGWSRRPKGDGRRGTGMAFARYKNIGAYCAVVMEVEVERETGAVTVHRVDTAVDAGLIANPDGIRNQVEGGIIQSLSWALLEEVTFDSSKRTSFEWGSYPILRFEDIPGEINVHLLNRPNLPFLGAGETSQGPASAALANAIADATGVRLRDMPLTPTKVKAAIGLDG